MRVSSNAREAAELGLAEALVPVLLHRLANATQLLGGVRALMDLEGELPEDASADLASLSRELDRTGFALAVVACAEGADLLLERRERRALAIAHELASAALAREHRALAPGELPEVVPSAADGWQLPWAATAAWVLAGRGLAKGETLTWSLEHAEDAGEAGLRVHARLAQEEVSRLRAALSACGAEIALAPDEAGASVRFPARWLAQRTREGASGAPGSE